MVFRWAGLVLCICGVGTAAFGRDPSHPRVPGYERFYSAPLTPLDEDEEPIKLDPVTGGRILLSELNCGSCHSFETTFALAKKQAPVLDEVGGRVRGDWLRDYLAHPHDVKPGTTMPDLIATLPAEERTRAVEALTQFLMSTGSLIEARSDPKQIQKGLDVIRKVGCLACHDSPEENAPRLANSVPLPDLGKKYSLPGLVQFLKEPLKARPSGRMPELELTEDELRGLGSYFVRSATPPNVKYSVYHGAWTLLPSFQDLTPVSEGVANGFDVSVANRPTNFAIRFTSSLKIVNPGEYKFWLGSDDGSKLIIDDIVVIDCDGIHTVERRNGQLTLTAGVHRVVVEYFQTESEARLEAQVAGKGLNRMPLESLVTLDIESANPGAVAANEGLIKQGRALFSSLGCAACHQLKIDGEALTSTLTAKALGPSIDNKGCLAAQPAGKAPRYDLNDKQRQSIATALSSQVPEEPAETVHRTLATFNCYACHERNKLGGVEEARSASFESLQKEMGEEGRLPPTLTGVGDKLLPEWMKQIFRAGAHERRNYLVVRMPRFGESNLEPLIDQFAAVDRRPDALPKADFEQPEYRIKADGRHLVGAQALGCIKCHDFGPHASTGVRAMSLTVMKQRLRPEWFYRYMLDPQVYRRGTRMPASWPFGQATIRDVLHGDVNLQVQAVWAYLSDRDKAAVPAGLVRETIELKPQSEPIVYRNFIEGAGTRAIGIGYPEGVNLAFDANEMRLAMIWHGAFIDASRHWTGRGQGFEPPLGDDVIPLPGNVPLVKSAGADSQPSAQSGRDAGFKFLGYSLDGQQRPIFRYSMSELNVEDHPTPEPGRGKAVGLKRTLRFTGSTEASPVWFRSIVASKIDPQSDRSWKIDDHWTLEADALGTDQPVIRESGSKKELLIPVRLRNRRAELVLHYNW